ncbi:MAG: hypothetical protein R2932_46275 [Caldilineaceae bacterium]
MAPPAPPLLCAAPAERNFHLDLQGVAGAPLRHGPVPCSLTPAQPNRCGDGAGRSCGLAQLALQHDLWLITDEVYANFYLHPSPHQPGLNAGIGRPGNHRLQSFQESHAMTG